MGGFKNELINVAFEKGIFNLIIVHLYNSSKNMRQECTHSGNQLINHEDRITDRLVARHLNKNTLGLMFIPQSPESFIPTNDQYSGRCDLKVISSNCFINPNDYYLIECKRIDGDNYLNRQYVLEGVARFVMNPVKYPSYHKRSIMFGYVVKSIDVPDNISKIGQLQEELLLNVQSEDFVLAYNESTEFYHYDCVYQSDSIGTLELAHLFYNFSSVMRSV